MTGFPGLNEPYPAQAERQLNSIITPQSGENLTGVNRAETKKPGDCGTGLSFSTGSMSIRRGAD
jgi:hypothetical protein